MSYNGCCFFAYNNDQIDYVKIAMLAALYVKKFMKNNNTCLITTEGDYNWLLESQDTELAERAFDEVVFTNNVEHKANVRKHHDSPWTTFDSHFKNSNKYLINTYSPFDKTLLLDIDYFVRNDSLDYLFENDISVGMFDSAIDLRSDTSHLYEQYLNPVGIPMWWSTVVYFDKSEQSQQFFDMWAHITEDYDFYKFLYNWPGKMYRTDYCVSVASHILNGMQQGEHIHKIIYGAMKYMDQKDDLIEIKDADDWIFVSNDRDENWKDILTRNKRDNLHVMNKRAIERNFDSMLEAVK